MPSPEQRKPEAEPASRSGRTITIQRDAERRKDEAAADTLKTIPPSFAERLQVSLLIATIAVIGYLFVRFLVEDIAESLHLTRHNQIIEPAGY